MRFLLRAVVGLAFLLIAAWGALALWYAGPRPDSLAGALALAFGLGIPLLLIAVRPFGRGVLAATAACALLLVWWNALEPSNDKDWAAEVARIPTGEIEGDRLTLRNVRNFTYRSENDFDEHWETRRYDLSRIRGLDLFLSYWAGDAIAHTILSWEFAGGDHLAVSIETRKDRTQAYSAVAGFFKQYELAYVAADERDLIKLRTNFRGERVYLYRLRVPEGRARAILEDYVRGMNALAAEPAFYNALTHNCTTTIRMHTQQVNPGAPPWDWRLAANGYVDELLYERGQIDTSLPFPELRERSRVDDDGRRAGDATDYSRRIRAGLPSR